MVGNFSKNNYYFQKLSEAK